MKIINGADILKLGELLSDLKASSSIIEEGDCRTCHQKIYRQRGGCNWYHVFKAPTVHEATPAEKPVKKWLTDHLSETDAIHLVERWRQSLKGEIPENLLVDLAAFAHEEGVEIGRCEYEEEN